MHNFSFNRMEGRRVTIDTNATNACNVIIENAGPEDDGEWKFEIVSRNVEEQKFLQYEHTASVIVRGTALLYFSF